MTFSEVYIGLQQHTIDAQENPYEVIVSNRLYEQQDYVVETNHLPHLISLIVNDSFFAGLSEEDQAILTRAANTATACAREQSDERISDRIATIEASGTEILSLSEETRNEIRSAAQPVYTSIQNTIDADIYAAYTKNLAGAKETNFTAYRWYSSYPPVIILFALLSTKTSGISPLYTYKVVIAGGFIFNASPPHPAL